MTTSSQSRPLRIAIDARLRDGESGGVQQAIIGLADGLSRRAAADEQYVFLTLRGADQWLRRWVEGWAGTLPLTDPPRISPLREMRLLRNAGRAARDALSAFRGAASISIPKSDGRVEAAGFDLVHFPAQNAFTCALPTIYQPWDLLHVDLPELFSGHERLSREVRYREFCRRAAAVVVPTAAGAARIAKHFSLQPERVQVVPQAAPTRAYDRVPDPVAARRRLAVPERFVFYPARTFPHKNHVRLLEALAVVRDRYGMTIPLVCSGATDDFLDTIRGSIRVHGLEQQVQFVGHVDPPDLLALYEGATAMIFPTLYEGWGLPILEAFDLGVPVGCADIEPLSTLTGDAALRFDPRSVDAIADAVQRLWREGDLRQTLCDRGRARSRDFNWDATADLYRALYRRLAGKGRAGSAGATALPRRVRNRL